MSSDFEREFEMALMNKELRRIWNWYCLDDQFLQYQFLQFRLFKKK